MNLSHGRRPPPPYDPERNREQPFDNPPPRHVCRCGENCFNATELDAHIWGEARRAADLDGDPF
jgi:hypothetical protein